MGRAHTIGPVPRVLLVLFLGALAALPAQYRLDFTQEEVDRLLFHLWELRDIAFAYFFFSENCSYQLLGLLEAARPGLDLSGGYAGWVIPIDTVRSIVEQAGITDEVVRRPPALEQIRHMGGALEPDPAGRTSAVRHSVDFPGLYLTLPGGSPYPRHRAFA